MIKLRSLPLYVSLCVLSSAILFPALSQGQGVAPAVRIISPIDESQLVRLSGNTNPRANAKNDLGPVSADFALPDLTLILSRSAEQQAAFDAFVAGQYNQNSPNYHQWLTPEQIGAQYGPAQADIATITGWLTGHGFTVKRVTPDCMTIHFSGTAAQVQSAFHTQIHSLSVNGVGHYANMTDPQIPAALAPVIVGVKALHNFLPQPQHKLGSLVQFDQQTGKWKKVTTAANARPITPPANSTPLNTTSKPALNPHPDFGINGNCGTNCTYLEEDLGPYDFATIYNVTPLWNNNITGNGQSIAIIGTSFINLGANSNSNKNSGANDVASFRSEFGLATNFPSSPTPNEIDAGSYFSTGTTATICTSTSSSAFCGIGDLEENSLDVEESGAVAPNAQIDLVVTGQSSACNGTTGAGCIDTLYDAAAYVVDNPATAKIMSVSYGECELGNGTAGNVAYYDLWQQAAAEGISVFVSTGDSGSPSCDDNQDQNYGNPYVAQYGLSVSGIASTPYNTAVGGTDLSWCQPYYNSGGNFAGCASSSTTQGSPAYWSTSNNGTTGASAAGYVPEIPWNDTCLNPINARYLETLLSAAGVDSYFGFSPSTPEESCSVVYNNWYEIYEYFDYYYSDPLDLAGYVDAIGGSGGASNCVVNNSSTTSSCTTTAGSSTTGSANGNIPTYNDGWVKPAWQTGITGIPSDGVRDLPDVSFFAGNGNFDSATLICVSNNGSCTLSGTTENTAQEVGGTSVATPQMAGVMALINQKAGGAQGLANPQLYQIASRQTYSSCSAESVSNSSSCYFQDIDNGPTAPNGPSYTTAQTISMPCNLTGTPEGGDAGQAFAGAASPNCAAINSGDTIGTLVSSGTTPGYNSTTGFDLATGLGSLNVANVVNAWVSDAGINSTTMTVTPTPSAITINQALSVVVSVTGTSGTPTGTITLSGDGYSSTETIGTSPCTSNTSCTFNIPANSLPAGSGLTFTAYYNGNSTYAANSKTTTITVNVMTPTIGVNAPASGNVANPITVTVSITAPSGGTATPTGTVYLKSGTYTSATETIGVSPCTTATSCSFTIPGGNTLSAGLNTITADYSGDANFAGGTNSTTINMTITVTLTPTITVTPSPSSIDTGQTLGVTVSVTGSGPTPTGTIFLTSGSYTSSTETIGTSPCTSNTSCSFTIPANKLAAGTDTLTAHYSGDANYASGSNTGSVSVTQSAYSLAATTPAAVAPGSPATSTITGTTSSTDYTGTVTLGTCSLTTSPTGAVSLPTCSASGTITYTNGTATGSGTATVYTTATSTVEMVRPKLPGGGMKGWLGAGSGAVLALLVFFGIPARRRNWRSMLSILVVMVVIGTLASCGGGSSGGGGGTTTIPGTTAGNYTFTVYGTGNDPASTQENTTFTVTVN
ncbi:MAG: protease pro-enzyme activation domain-containing protein [Terracidiphilus sp.]|jgi:hypothetical protein